MWTVFMAYSKSDLREDASGYGDVLAVREAGRTDLSPRAGRRALLITRSEVYDSIRASFLHGLCAEIATLRDVTCYRGWDDPGPESQASLLGSWFSPMRPTIREEYRRGTAAALQYETGGGNRLDQAGEFSISSGAHVVVGRASPQRDLALGFKLPGGAIQFWLARPDFFGYLTLVRSWDAHRGDPGVVHQI